MQRILAVFKYIKRAISFLKKFENQHLKIDSIVEDPEKELLFLIIRINGKCTPPMKKMPYELLMESNVKISSMFNQKDFNLLIQTMLENQKRVIKRKYKKNYLLIKHQYSEHTGEPLLVYQNTSTGQFYIKPAQEIFSDIDLIQNFDSRDSACIGNIVGSYEAEKELKNRSASNYGSNNVIRFDNSVLTN